MNSLKLALVATIVLVSFPPQAEGADLNTAMTVRVYENFDDGYSYKPLSLAAAVYMGGRHWSRIVKADNDAADPWEISFTYNDIAALRATESGLNNGTAYKIRLKARLTRIQSTGNHNLELKCTCLYVTATANGKVKWENPQGSNKDHWFSVATAPDARFRFRSNKLDFEGFSND